MGKANYKWGNLREEQRQDNTNVCAKIALRLWMLDLLSEKPTNISVLDVYGAFGMMYRQVWEKGAGRYEGSQGDALEWLETHDLNYDIYDIDPWGSPYEALAIINRKATLERIGIVATDGYLLRHGQMRGYISRVLQETMGWPKKDNSLLAAIYYDYSAFLRGILVKLMNRYDLQRLAVAKNRGKGKQGGNVAYFAGVFRVSGKVINV